MPSFTPVQLQKARQHQERPAGRGMHTQGRAGPPCSGVVARRKGLPGAQLQKPHDTKGSHAGSELKPAHH